MRSLAIERPGSDNRFIVIDEPDCQSAKDRVSDMPQMIAKKRERILFSMTKDLPFTITATTGPVVDTTSQGS